nr:hypothetical protein Iba_chr09dCG11010 [Ipomoea batatas]
MKTGEDLSHHRTATTAHCLSSPGEARHPPSPTLPRRKQRRETPPSFPSPLVAGGSWGCRVCCCGPHVEKEREMSEEDGMGKMCSGATVELSPVAKACETGSPCNTSPHLTFLNLKPLSCMTLWSFHIAQDSSAKQFDLHGCTLLKSLSLGTWEGL